MQQLVDTPDFWTKLDRFVIENEIVIDRPRDSAHPRYPLIIYPCDYGYLEGTQTMDGGGVDVWVGRLADAAVTALICTVDLYKMDAELKILLGCTPEEGQAILQIHNQEGQAGILIWRPVK
jgi:inorganic pyrophosphatase